MSKFFVGCRVRIVRSFATEVSPGTETVITGRSPYYIGEWSLGLRIAGYESVCAPEYCLEPIVPPHEASQYSYTELMDSLKAGEVECV